jgi:enamine deaminase RidA (YjgF/YER057c/UK114 family)
VRAAKIAFTGTQIAFGTDEKAAELAFQRIDRDLSEAGVEPGDVIETRIYALSARAGELARRITTGAGSAWIMRAWIMPVEGIASLDGSFAVDVVAAAK